MTDTQKKIAIVAALILFLGGLEFAQNGAEAALLRVALLSGVAILAFGLSSAFKR